jgi:menaquinone-dependent protoporphyrinogen oxidase
MKTLILYATRHGCAEKCAAKLGAALHGEVKTAHLKDAGAIDLSDYETVVIGGSIHAGKIQKVVKSFCAKNLEALKNKRLGLFLCCMEEGPKAEEQFAGAFPEVLIGAATAKGLFGGEFDFDRMNWLEKAIIKKISKIEASVSKIKEQAILDFAAVLSGPAA